MEGLESSTGLTTPTLISLTVEAFSAADWAYAMLRTQHEKDTPMKGSTMIDKWLVKFGGAADTEETSYAGIRLLVKMLRPGFRYSDRRLIEQTVRLVGPDAREALWTLFDGPRERTSKCDFPGIYISAIAGWADSPNDMIVVQTPKWDLVGLAAARDQLWAEAQAIVDDETAKAA